jgi:hypothetical protein
MTTRLSQNMIQTARSNQMLDKFFILQREAWASARSSAPANEDRVDVLKFWRYWLAGLGNQFFF